MRRPEGFDRRPERPAPARPATPAPAPAAKRTPARTSSGSTAAGRKAAAPRAAPKTAGQKAAAPKPSTASSSSSAAPPPAAPRPRRIPRRAPSPARAEFAAAERTRKREERAEIRRFTRRSRHRRTAWLAVSGLVAAMLLMIVAAVFSPLLALRTITVDGTQRLDPTALRAAVSSQLGTPLALLDTGRIQSALGAFPLIRSYTTELVPPDTLLIHVTERSPIGVVQTATGFDTVDPAGVVIQSSTTRPTGLTLIGIADTKSPAFLAASEVLLALPASVQKQVASVNAATRDDVTLTLTGSGQRVVWGPAVDSDAKAQKLSYLLSQYAGAGPGAYDVSAPGVATWHSG